MTSIFLTKPKAAEAQVRRPVLDPIKALDSVRRVRSEDQLRAAFAEIAARGGTSTAKILVEGDFSISSAINIPRDAGAVDLDLGGFTLTASRDFSQFLGIESYGDSGARTVSVRNGTLDCGEHSVGLALGLVENARIEAMRFFVRGSSSGVGIGGKVHNCTILSSTFGYRGTAPSSPQGSPTGWEDCLVSSCVFSIPCHDFGLASGRNGPNISGCIFEEDVTADSYVDEMVLSGNTFRGTLTLTLNEDDSIVVGNMAKGGTITDSGTNNTVADNVT